MFKRIMYFMFSVNCSSFNLCFSSVCVYVCILFFNLYKKTLHLQKYLSSSTNKTQLIKRKERKKKYCFTSSCRRRSIPRRGTTNGGGVAAADGEVPCRLTASHGVPTPSALSINIQWFTCILQYNV